MFRAVIVEDEKPILDLMKVIIGRNTNYMIVGAFNNPFEALESLSELRPDIAFIDVEMPKMNGLELSQKIRKLSLGIEVVFTTAYKNYAIEAFGVEALDYILKPVTPTSIERVTERLINRHHSSVANKPSKKLSLIQCFGKFEVRNLQGAVLRFPTRKTEELLAFFLCHPGQDVNKWRLAELLWPDMQEDRSSHNLHNTIYLLKKLLKEQQLGLDIQKTNDGYLLETGDEEYDMLAYYDSDFSFVEELFSLSDAERLCSLYKGPLLDGKPYLWKVSLEENLEKRYSALVRRLIQEEIAAQNWSRAEQRLDTYLNVYPLEEGMNLLLIEVYASRGNKELISRHYKKFEAAYRNGLGLEPPIALTNRVAAYLKAAD